jgi:hypothetical protein
MKSIKNLFQQTPFYPLLLGLYPVLFLWAANFVQITWVGVERSLIIAVCITVIVFLACILLLRNLIKAAALAGLMLVLFYSFGQLFPFIDQFQVFGFIIGRYRYILILWGVMFAVGAFFILKTSSDLRNMTLTLNLVGCLLITYTLGQLGYLTITHPSQNPQKTAGGSKTQVASTTQSVQQNTPDVYYIVLDGYDREDLLKDDFDLDNSKFISSLEALGFVVPDCTTSNYNNTVTSIGTTLNMNYLDALGYSYSELAQVDPMVRLASLPIKNLVMQKFMDMGYKIITLKSVWPFINYPNSDIVYDFQADSGALAKLEAYKFQYMFMMTTMLRTVILVTQAEPDKFNNLPQPILDFINPLYNKYSGLYVQTYRQNVYQLDKLESVAQVPGNKFLYAHLMATHTPFVFTASGNYRIDRNINFSSDDSSLKKGSDKQGYINSISYVNGRILTIVKKILAESKTPPIIILQGDHASNISGRRDNRQFKILNAYYLPQNGNEKIYPNITPVNTFRLIFSYYFNQDYPLLPDQSIWIKSGFPGGYMVVPQTCVP